MNEIIYDYAYKNDGTAYFFRGAKNDPELRELKEFIMINNSENN